MMTPRKQQPLMKFHASIPASTASHQPQKIRAT